MKIIWNNLTATICPALSGPCSLLVPFPWVSPTAIHVSPLRGESKTRNRQMFVSAHGIASPIYMLSGQLVIQLWRMFSFAHSVGTNTSRLQIFLLSGIAHA